MSVLQHARHCLRRGKSSLHQRARRLGRQKKAVERQKAHAGDDIWCFHDVPEVQALEPCWVSHISACTGEPKLHVACGRCRRQYVGTPSCSRELQLWVGYTCCFILHAIKQSKAEKYNKSHTDKKKKKVSGRAVRLSNPGLQSMPMDIQEFVLSCPLLKYFLFCKWDVPASSASLLPHQLSAGYNTESGGLWVDLAPMNHV